MDDWLIGHDSVPFLSMSIIYRLLNDISDPENRIVTLALSIYTSIYIGRENHVMIFDYVWCQGYSNVLVFPLSHTYAFTCGLRIHISRYMCVYIIWYPPAQTYLSYMFMTWLRPKGFAMHICTEYYACLYIGILTLLLLQLFALLWECHIHLYLQ